MTSSLTTNSNTNQYTHRLFLVPQVAFTIKKKPFISPHSLIHHHRLFFASSIIKNITNTYTHYQLAFLVSSIQIPILARIGHLMFTLSNFTFFYVTLLSHPCHSHIQLSQKSHTNGVHPKDLPITSQPLHQFT